MSAVTSCPSALGRIELTTSSSLLTSTSSQQKKSKKTLEQSASTPPLSATTPTSTTTGTKMVSSYTNGKGFGQQQGTNGSSVLHHTKEHHHSGGSDNNDTMSSGSTAASKLSKVRRHSDKNLIEPKTLLIKSRVNYTTKLTIYSLSSIFRSVADCETAVETSGERRPAPTAPTSTSLVTIRRTTPVFKHQM